MRTLLLSFALLAGAACYQPGGRCSSDRDCPSDTHCSGGLCLIEGASAAGERCEDPRDCLSACCACSANVCVLREGGCQLHSDCDEWERCQDSSCVPISGRCNAKSDCDEWQTCSAGHTCVPDVGRCETSVHCSAWEYCERSAHRCVEVGPACTTGSACQAWQTCTTGHCVNQPGRCAVTDQCDPTWQLCANHLCQTAPGRCADDSGCDTDYQACVAHSCKVRPGMCGSSRDCEDWEECSEAHLCTLRAGYCMTHSDCPADKGCNSAHLCVENRSEEGGHQCRNIRVIGPIHEQQRFQVFVAGDRPRLTEVLLTIHKGPSTRGTLTVALHSASTMDVPASVLETKTVSTSDIETTFSKVSVPFAYNSLKAGERYAIVLGQSDRPETCDDGRCYYWCTGDNHPLPGGHLDNGTWKMDPDTGAATLVFKFR